jgi:uncharacterized protein involved in exopolysaccharide biosynthesis
MRILISGIAAALVLGVIAGFVFFSANEPAYTAYTRSSVRLADPGENLVGADWSGIPTVTANRDSGETGAGSTE